MFIDSRGLPTGTVIQADICIIGAGAAGITMAREFIKRSLKVVLLESGGFTADPETQSLYIGENVGLAYATDSTRSRFLGGSTNCWVGWCRPFDPIDFERRSWVPESGWPIRHDQLIDYYERAREVLQLSSATYGPDSWREHLASLGLEFLPLPDGVIRNQINLFSPPTRFGEAYREQLADATDVHVYLYANVTELEPDSNGSTIKRVRVATLEGKKLAVHATTFILAAGGVENARLLLLSNKVTPAGLGNGYDLVGRYFMEHPRLRGSKIRLRQPHRHRRLYDSTLVMSRRRLNTRSLRMGVDLAPTEKAQRQYGLQNSRTYLSALYRGDGSPELEALRLCYALVKDRRKYGYDLKDLARHVHRSLPTLAARLPQLAASIYDYGVNPNHPAREFWLDTIIEPVPNRDSRITLSHDRDALGLNRPRIDLRLTDQDRDTFFRTQRLLCGELQASGVVSAEESLLSHPPPWPEEVFWCSHHMGTTRMADDPRTGVVDANCRVHGIANLYIAGSSVFPTGGSDIPTMTIVAMALRLADHLGAILTQPLSVELVSTAHGNQLRLAVSR